jgi:hypothetical protein
MIAQYKWTARTKSTKTSTKLPLFYNFFSKTETSTNYELNLIIFCLCASTILILNRESKNWNPATRTKLTASPHQSQFYRLPHSEAARTNKKTAETNQKGAKRLLKTQIHRLVPSILSKKLTSQIIQTVFFRSHRK